ncbi:MAG: ATP-dependent helicase HrpB [Planctomycetaceae bacterium]
MPAPSPLPIDRVLPELIERLRDHPAVVLQAPTGTGKTTRVAPALLDAGAAGAGQVIVLEPRRVAARAAARRIAFEREVALGTEVGYQVRFDQQTSRQTRIRIVTDGILLRMLHDDPFLEDTGVVVFDEFHERGLNVDLALAMVRRVQQSVRSDLKIVVMSATFDPAAIAAYLGRCPVVSVEGRQFPVAVEYLDVGPLLARRTTDPRSRWQRGRNAGATQGDSGVSRAVEIAIRRTSGHVLVFLPGVREILRAADELKSLAEQHDFVVLPLYGDLSPEQQDLVLAPSEKRKLILATNVAETSLTIDGVTAVVDSGLARILRYDEHIGLDRLELSRISKASADQRAGRAGRTGPGLCLRLWSERDQRGLVDHEAPEIRRVDLAGAALQLLAWGERDLVGFPWFEPPRESLVTRARDLLARLGAQDGGEITALGCRMARLPVHPRLARLLLEGQRWNVSDAAALAAALLSERDPFSRDGQSARAAGRAAATHRSESDLVDRVAAILEFERTGGLQHPAGALRTGAARYILQARNQLLNLLRGEPGAPEASPARQGASTGRASDSSLALRRTVLAAFPDRVARRRQHNRDRAVMVGGRGVRLAAESAVTESELFVCVDIDAGSGEALVRQASGVEREWLDSKLVTTRDLVTFDPRTERASAARQVLFDDLVLEETALAHVPQDQIAAALARAATENFERVFPNRGDVPDYVDRVRCLAEWMPELGLPVLDAARLKQLLPELSQNCRTFDDLRKAPWLRAIKGLLSPAQLQAVEREAPEKLTVPSGGRAPIRYQAGHRPVLAVRIQELFGLAQTPRIAAGRVPLLLHLLAPNMRPQQVTDDLQSFWNTTYQQVRKELRVRYPKHAWPEDPWNAAPTRKPQARGRK